MDMADKKRMSRLSSTFCKTRGICAAHSMAPSKTSVRGRRISICDRCNARCPAALAVDCARRMASTTATPAANPAAHAQLSVRRRAGRMCSQARRMRR